MISVRVSAIRAKMQKDNIDAFLVTRPENVYYLSGSKGVEGYLVITPDKTMIITDFRYLEQAAAQAPQCKIVDISGEIYKSMGEVLSPYASIAYEEDFLTVKQLRSLQEFIQSKWLPYDGVVEKLRMVKDEDELNSLRQAAKIADDAFLHILKIIVPGISEVEIAGEMEYFMRKAGSEGPSFEFIVASGGRGALPHGSASTKKIANGEMVTLDFGAIYNGYHSDITRTVAVGEPTDQMLKIYDLVYEAQTSALAQVQAGKRCSDIDAVARGIISDAGFGDNFRHGLGHGVGLEIHEEPRFNKVDHSILAANMVITVEPGIYLPGIGGVRIEDSVIVLPDGYELLTKVSKDLVIL